VAEPLQLCMSDDAEERTTLVLPPSPETSASDRLPPAWDVWRVEGWDPRCDSAGVAGQLARTVEKIIIIILVSNVACTQVLRLH